MEPGGGTSGVKPVDVHMKRVDLHDTDNSRQSVSTASNTTLLHLEATDAERALNEDERRERKLESSKEKLEIRRRSGNG